MILKALAIRLQRRMILESWEVREVSESCYCPNLLPTESFQAVVHGGETQVELSGLLELRK